MRENGERVWTLGQEGGKEGEGGEGAVAEVVGGQEFSGGGIPGFRDSREKRRERRRRRKKEGMKENGERIWTLG